MAAHRARQTGSAFTVWYIGDKPVIFCQEVSHRAPQPVAAPIPVQPLNYLRPIEIIVPRATTHGEITMTVMETYDLSIWQHLEGLNVPIGVQDLADFFNWMMTNTSVVNEDGSSNIELKRIIRDPTPNRKWRVSTYENARVVDIRYDETTRVDTTLNPLTISVWYTRMTEKLEERQKDGTGPAGDNHITDPVWGG